MIFGDLLRNAWNTAWNVAGHLNPFHSTVRQPIQRTGTETYVRDADNLGPAARTRSHLDALDRPSSPIPLPAKSSKPATPVSKASGYSSTTSKYISSSFRSGLSADAGNTPYRSKYIPTPSSDLKRLAESYSSSKKESSITGRRPLSPAKTAPSSPPKGTRESPGKKRQRSVSASRPTSAVSEPSEKRAKGTGTPKPKKSSTKKSGQAKRGPRAGSRSRKVASAEGGKSSIKKRLRSTEHVTPSESGHKKKRSSSKAKRTH